MDVMLFIGNLPAETTEAELQSLFEQAGEVTAIRILKFLSKGVSRCFGYLSMSTQSEADKAVSRFNKYELKDHVLNVSQTRPRVQGGIMGPVFEP